MDENLKYELRVKEKPPERVNIMKWVKE